MESKKTNSSIREATQRVIIYDLEHFEEDYLEKEALQEQEESIDWTPAWQPYCD